MPAFILHARERSILERNPITAAQIASAFREGPPTGNPEWGAWVGPAPRVTRQSMVGDAFYTDAAWLYSIPEGDYLRQHPATPQHVVEILRSNLTAALRDLSRDWSAVEVIPYAPQANGAVSWWQDPLGASNTRTKDTFPVLAARFDPPENPVGPDSVLPHVTTFGDLVVPLVIAAAATAVLYGVATTAVQTLLQRPAATPRVRSSRPRRRLPRSR